MRSLTGHTERVAWVQFSDDGAQVISGSDDETVCESFFEAMLISHVWRSSV